MMFPAKVIISCQMLVILSTYIVWCDLSWKFIASSFINF